MAVAPLTPDQAAARVLSRTRITETDCWLFEGAKNDRGYGQIRFAGSVKYTHRLIYELVNGNVEAGLFVCHTCDMPACVNPQHLFAGTHLDNMDDMMRKGRRTYPLRSHCKQGHEMDDSNSGWTRSKYRKSGYQRYCIACLDRRKRGE